MKYTTFNPAQVDIQKEPMFLGENVNVSRFDIEKYNHFQKLIETQLSFFWRPDEVDISKDRADYQKLSEHEQHIFVSNLKYQTLLDSIQGRGPSVAFLPLCSLPELETWIETWSFVESAIHAKSYTHILRNVFDNPSDVFDDIVINEAIIDRAKDISKYYDDLISLTAEYQVMVNNPFEHNDDELTRQRTQIKRALYLCMVAVNALEAIRFYVSFACSFAFAERKLMEGNAKIIKLIARDEALHLSGTQYILKTMASGKDDPEMAQIAKQCREEATEIFTKVAEQEKAWAKYLFKDGSMIGLNEKIVCEYVEYLTNSRMNHLSFDSPYPNATKNPIPWIRTWFNSDSVQVAPQETEISSYLVGQVDSTIDDAAFEGLEL